MTVALVVSPFKIYSVNNFQARSAVLLTTALHMRRPGSSHHWTSALWQPLPIPPTSSSDNQHPSLRFCVWLSQTPQVSATKRYSSSSYECIMPSECTGVVAVPSFPRLRNMPSLRAPHVLDPFIHPWILRLFPYLEYGKEGAGMNVGVWLRLQHPDSTSLRYIPEVWCWIP